MNLKNDDEYGPNKLVNVFKKVFLILTTSIFKTNRFNQTSFDCGLSVHLKINDNSEMVLSIFPYTVSNFQYSGE